MCEDVKHECKAFELPRFPEPVPLVGTHEYALVPLVGTLEDLEL